jgi:hypothetical protein
LNVSPRRFFSQVFATVYTTSLDGTPLVAVSPLLWLDATPPQVLPGTVFVGAGVLGSPPSASSPAVITTGTAVRVAWRAMDAPAGRLCSASLVLSIVAGDNPVTTTLHAGLDLTGSGACVQVGGKGPERVPRCPTLHVSQACGKGAGGSTLRAAHTLVTLRIPFCPRTPHSGPKGPSFYSSCAPSPLPFTCPPPQPMVVLPVLLLQTMPAAAQVCTEHWFDGSAHKRFVSVLTFGPGHTLAHGDVVTAAIASVTDCVGLVSPASQRSPAVTVLLHAPGIADVALLPCSDLPCSQHLAPWGQVASPTNPSLTATVVPGPEVPLCLLWSEARDPTAPLAGRWVMFVRAVPASSSPLVVPATVVARHPGANLTASACLPTVVTGTLAGNGVEYDLCLQPEVGTGDASSAYCARMLTDFLPPGMPAALAVVVAASLEANGTVRVNTSCSWDASAVVDEVGLQSVTLRVRSVAGGMLAATNVITSPGFVLIRPSDVPAGYPLVRCEVRLREAPRHACEVAPVLPSWLSAPHLLPSCSTPWRVVRGLVRACMWHSCVAARAQLTAVDWAGHVRVLQSSTAAVPADPCHVSQGWAQVTVATEGRGDTFQAKGLQWWSAAANLSIPVQIDVTGTGWRSCVQQAGGACS